MMGHCAQVDTIPARAGIGLRPPHYGELLRRTPSIGWLEIHSENYFCAGGEPHYFLERLRALYPLSFHGVGLSLGSVDDLCHTHLHQLKTLIARYQPGLVSEHLSWGSINGSFANDLLPLPYTEEALRHLSARVTQAQEFLGRRMLIENISSYLQFAHSTIPEWEFIVALAAATGCGILLDVNNIYVNAVNHRFDAENFLRAIPRAAVMEIHLAGFEVSDGVLIDTHGARVDAAVWELYQTAVQRFGAVPTLIEWDTDIPSLDVLLTEANTADQMLVGAYVDAA